MLLDNKKNGKVGDELRRHLTDGSRLSVISGLFSIYGFDALKKELRHIDGLRLVLSQSLASASAREKGSASLAGDRFELRFKNQLNQAQVAKEQDHHARHGQQLRFSTRRVFSGLERAEQNR